MDRDSYYNVWCIKIRTNLSTVSLLCLVRFLMHQTLLQGFPTTYPIFPFEGYRVSVWLLQPISIDIAWKPYGNPVNPNKHFQCTWNCPISNQVFDNRSLWAEEKKRKEKREEQKRKWTITFIKENGIKEMQFLNEELLLWSWGRVFRF